MNEPDAPALGGVPDAQEVGSIPPVYSGGAHELWRDARDLSGEHESEWTFPIFASRVMASQPLGFDLAYEDLQSWEQLVGLLRRIDTLRAGGAPEQVLDIAIGIGLRVHD